MDTRPSGQRLSARARWVSVSAAEDATSYSSSTRESVVLTDCPPGPGGQSVNTTDSRVELDFDVRSSAVLTDTQRARALRRWPEGRVSIAASEHRSQHRNRVAARERLADLLREALAPPPPPRRPTRPSRGAKERRLKAKKERAGTKALRGRVREQRD